MALGLASECYNLRNTLTRHDAFNLRPPPLQGSDHLGQPLPSVVYGSHAPQWPGVIQDSGNGHIVHAQLTEVGGSGSSQIVGAKVEASIFLNPLAHPLKPLDVSTSRCRKDKFCVPGQGPQFLYGGQGMR